MEYTRIICQTYTSLSIIGVLPILLSLAQISPSESNELERRKKFYLSKANKDIQDFYNQNPGLDYVPSSEHKIHAQFDGNNVDGENTLRHIDSVYRIRKGGFKGRDESMYFTETYTGHDRRGQRISKFVVNGKHQKPLGQYQFDEISGENRCTGVEDWETVYDIAYNPKELDEFVDKGQIDDRTRYYVGTDGGRIYGGFEYEDFRTLGFDDLVFIGKTGSRPTPEEKDKELKSKANKNQPSGLKE